MTICCVPGCSNKPGKRTGITFHKFPKDVKRRKLWEIAVRRKDKVHERAVICSEHFRVEDVDRTSVSCVRIRENAVPSVFLTFPKQFQKGDKPKRRQQNKKVKKMLTEAGTLVTSESTTLASNQSVQTIIFVDSVLLSPTDSCDHSYATPDPQDPQSRATTIEMQDTTQKAKANDPTSKTKGITTQNVTTPKPKEQLSEIAVRRKLEDANAMLVRGRKRIKLLLQQNRRLLKKTVKLKSLIMELKKRSQAREDRLTSLENTLPGASVDLLKLQFLKSTNDLLPAAYTPQLKSFAMNLHFYSPRAYMYVRKAFNTCLPHPRTVTRWLKSTDGKPAFTAEHIEVPEERATEPTENKWSFLFCLFRHLRSLLMLFFSLFSYRFASTQRCLKQK